MATKATHLDYSYASANGSAYNLVYNGNFANTKYDTKTLRCRLCTPPT